MSDILYSKLRLEVPSALDGENATITSEHGNSRVVQMSSPITDIMLAGMEKYRVQAGNTDEEVSLGYGQIKKVVVFDIPEIYNTVKNAIGNVTEIQWLEFVDSGCIALARELGETSSFIGKNVTLSNTVVSNYTSWKIADFNHDSSGDTVDLVQNNTVYSSNIGSSKIYSSSNVRAWLTETYLPGFSTDIKNKLQTMSVSSDSSVLSDKIKLLSFTEVNGSTGTTSTYYVTEGSQYPIFTDDASRVRTGVKSDWWLRSRNTDSASNAWRIYTTGTLSSTAKTYECGVLPCLRFA